MKSSLKNLKAGKLSRYESKKNKMEQIKLVPFLFIY